MSIDAYVVHTPGEIEGIRRAASAAAAVRDSLASMLREGMTTRDVDDLGGTLIANHGGRSAFLGYKGFPGQICVSVNDEVVHGIGRPGRCLRAGDVVSLDIGINLGGFIGDCAATVSIGRPRPGVELLLRATQDALAAGVAACRPGAHVADIGAAVESVARPRKLGIVREYVGHGVGVRLHEPPEIPNFKPSKRGARLRPGMVLAIEPMLNLGTHKVKTDPDGWTVRTCDGRDSAHFEHMVLVTENEPEILTWRRMS